MTAAGLEKLCMGFNGVTHDIKWGNDLCYSVGSKMFCVTSLLGMQYVSFKTTPQEFGELIERDGIIPAPYSARHHWVLVEDIRSLRPAEWTAYIQKSYTIVFEKLPKKVRNEILGFKSAHR